MKFFSGFCFSGERELFDEYLEDSEFCIAGFSKGAQEAFEYTFTCKDRIDKLQLISPAFFQDRDEKFKKIQLISFKRDKKAYMETFLKNALFPSDKDISRFFKEGSYDELKSLLYYEWDRQKLREISSRGIEIEVFIGKKDKIINPKGAADFFTPFGEVYLFKDLGHTL